MLYDLVAVSNHYGSLAFGHYTAYAKNFETGKWYDYNDSSVSSVYSYNSEGNGVVTKDAYVLYYVRKDFFPDGNIDFNQIRIGLENDTNTVQYQKSLASTMGTTPEDATMVSMSSLTNLSE